MTHKIYITKILDSIIETENVKTILFNHSKTINPGEFYMIWIPGVDEIPMSVSIIKPDVKGITFRNVGEATNELYRKKVDDKIGIRGPYGNGFSLEGDKILFVAGGTGTAMINPAVERTINQGKDVSVIIGAKTKKELFFIKRIKHTKAKVFITTDDGTEGTKGLATQKAEELISEQNFDSVFTCGPEMMMKGLYQICENKDIIFEASLERYMKCGAGLCGQCAVGKGLRVCVEGPVFSKSQLKDIKDFGMFTRDASGKKIFFINNKPDSEE